MADSQGNRFFGHVETAQYYRHHHRGVYGGLHHPKHSEPGKEAINLKFETLVLELKTSHDTLYGAQGLGDKDFLRQRDLV